MGIIRWARRLVYLALTTLGITMIAVVMATYWAMDRFSAERDFDKKLDVVVVLAAGLEPDGLLTFASRRRIRTGVWLLQNGRTDRLILSGGQISEDVNISTFMRDFTIEIGATEANIELEAQSRTTWENLRFSYSLLDRPEYQRVGILTDASHLPRTLVLNAYLSGAELVPISSFGQFTDSRWRRVTEIMREAMAWWYNLGKIAIWEITGWFGLSEAERGQHIF